MSQYNKKAPARVIREQELFLLNKKIIFLI